MTIDPKFLRLSQLMTGGGGGNGDAKIKCLLNQFDGFSSRLPDAFMVDEFNTRNLIRWAADEASPGDRVIASFLIFVYSREDPYIIPVFNLESAVVELQMADLAVVADWVKAPFFCY